MSLGGRVPVNPSGGLLSRGHPPGGTAVAQLAELIQQLRGQAVAGRRQVANARVALAQCRAPGSDRRDAALVRSSSGVWFLWLAVIADRMCVRNAAPGLEVAGGN